MKQCTNNYYATDCICNTHQRRMKCWGNVPNNHVSNKACKNEHCEVRHEDEDAESDEDDEWDENDESNEE